MLVLFDHGTPKGLARALSEHTVHTAQSRGWDTLNNGALLDAAEEAGFALLLTTDRRIRYQQNLRVRRLALVVLTGSTKWSRVREHADRIAALLRQRPRAATRRSTSRSSRNVVEDKDRSCASLADARRGDFARPCYFTGLRTALLRRIFRLKPEATAPVVVASAFRRKDRQACFESHALRPGPPDRG